MEGKLLWLFGIFYFSKEYTFFYIDTYSPITNFPIRNNKYFIFQFLSPRFKTYHSPIHNNKNKIKKEGKFIIHFVVWIPLTITLWRNFILPKKKKKLLVLFSGKGFCRVHQCTGGIYRLTHVLKWTHVMSWLPPMHWR